MEYDQALEYIHSVSWLGSKPGLERTRTLLDMMGNPQDKLKFVHIVGTNGKGSVSSMLASVLKEAGYRTGLYTSPYIVRFNDRIRFNGRSISDKELGKITEYVKGFAERMQDSPTEFELVTAIGFEFFYRKKCDVVVLEAGMGGELDSTNVIGCPLLSVITRIGLDHTKVLGDTIEKITRTKCGIIKGGDVVAFSDAESFIYIKEECEKRSSALHGVDPLSVRKKEKTLNGLKLDYKEHTDIELPLIGLYQYENAALALEACDLLKKHFNITDAALRAGLKKTKWQARFEVLSKRRIMIFDGGHNPQGVTAAAESFKAFFPGEKVTVVFGVMADKEVEKMLEIIAPITDKMITVTVDNPRSMKSEELAELAKKLGIDAVPGGTPTEALKAVRDEKKVFILGSLYMYPEVKAFFDVQRSAFKAGKITSTQEKQDKIKII